MASRVPVHAEVVRHASIGLPLGLVRPKTVVPRKPVIPILYASPSKVADDVPSAPTTATLAALRPEAAWARRSFVRPAHVASVEPTSALNGLLVRTQIRTTPEAGPPASSAVGLVRRLLVPERLPPGVA